MAKARLLIVGSLDANALEVLETAIELGYAPINIVGKSQKPLDDIEWFPLDEIPRDIVSLPAVLGGTPRYKDLRGVRIDVAWRQRTKRFLSEAEEAGIRQWLPLIHPSACVSPSVTIGKGVFVGPLVSISSESSIGDFTRLGRNSTIGHHVSVGQVCQIGPGVVVPGSVTIEEGVTVGPGAVLLNHVIVGAGAVVTRSVKPGRQAMGNPARTRLRPISAARKHSKKIAKWILKRLGLFDAVKQRFKRPGR